MSRLEELIQQLCPDGVEYRPLGKIAEIRSGWGFPNKEQGKEQGEIPFYKVSDMNSAGNEMYMMTANNYIDDLTAKRLKCKPAPVGTIIFPKIGAAISTNKKRILVCHSCYDNNIMGLIASQGIEYKYLYYLMDSVDLISFADYSGAMPSIRKSTMENHYFPVPPLPVQQEIVRILDSFTELTAELTVELTARKKQYEYYRDALLTFEDDTPTCKMGEVLKFLNGRAYKQSELLGKGKYPVLRVGNFYTNDSWYYSDLELPEDKYCNEGDLLYSWAATLGPKIWRGERCIFHYHIWKILFDESVIDKTYLYYYLQHDLSLISRSTTKSTMIHVSMGSMKERPIKLPSIVEQRRIASLISKFDDLSSSITDGLPAEIEARKKQYEYYRDKLLSFKGKT